MNKILISIVAVVIVILAGAFLLSNKTNKQPVVKTPTVQSQTEASPSAKTEEATVTLTQSGFDPQTLTVKVGTKVTWINKSGEEAAIDSDPHPIHTSYPPLNLGAVADGGSLSLTFDQKGTYNYHNHLNPSEKGTVIVE